MQALDLFKCTDDISDMEQSLIDDGLIGVSGGRVSVRNKLGEVIEKLNILKKEDEDGFIFLTYDHPDTELGYAWDATRYSLDQAKSIVISSYDKRSV